MKIIIAQLNYTVGDIEGNLNKILSVYGKISHEDGLLVCSELALSGYYPQDLVNRAGILERQDRALEKLALATTNNRCGVIVGCVLRNTAATGKKLHNGLVLLSNGKTAYEYHKRLLPTYNVFDEARHFEPGNNSGRFDYKGVSLGFLICEDAWVDTQSLKYAVNPIEELMQRSHDLVISINASPNNLGKLEERKALIGRVAKQLGAPIVYVNQVGGNDELVFDGASFVVNDAGDVVYQMTGFEEQVGEIESEDIATLARKENGNNAGELIRQQTVLGIRDYVGKCGFSKVVIGSSGGIDSAVTLAICSEALGSKNVTAITMPSKFSSAGSVDDSLELCRNLGIELLTAPIAEEFVIAVKQFEKMSGVRPSGLTQENMQARIRGRILMEYSNHFGALVISTGNKSEMSVGYATLYGDMNGGVNPLGDLYKMEVYALARLFNERANKELVPLSIIEKEPSAELSEDQRDSDSLPEYPLLDAILKLYIEGDLLGEEERGQCEHAINEYGASAADLIRVHRLVDKAEFKRRQAPPIIRVQKRSFGMGRRLPVAAKY